MELHSQVHSEIQKVFRNYIMESILNLHKNNCTVGGDKPQFDSTIGMSVIIYRVKFLESNIFH